MSARGVDLQDREVLTVPELAKRSGISRECLRVAMARARDPLPHSTVGRWPRIRWSAFVGWLERQEVGHGGDEHAGSDELRRRGARLAARERSTR